MRIHPVHGVSLVLVLAGIRPFPAPAQAPETNPAPGEEVMRPTRLGLRLTPAMARGISRVWMRDQIWQDLDLSDEQERDIADATSRRMMEIAHRGGREGQGAMEYFIETMIATEGKLNAQNCKEFAERVEPLTRGAREFIDGIKDDARPFLDDEQFERLGAQVDKQRRILDRFERRLANYREGRIEGEENPFDEIEAEEQNVPGQPKVDERVRNARRSAEWEIRRISSWDWGRFLAGAVAAFKFDDQQKARGDALLAEYRKKADAITTPEWKARVQRNRMLNNLQWQLGDAPRGPWMYRLQREYQDAIRPLEELTTQFQGEVLALATGQQRADALEETRGAFEKHGVVLSDVDIALLQGLIHPALSPQAGG